MKAAVYPGDGLPLTVESLPDPTPNAGEVVIRVHRCGICGTDLHMTEGHPWQFPSGCVPGHEYSGEVVAVGKSVDNLKMGDLITALPSTGCGKCAACLQGNLALCHNAPGVMGGFAEYMSIPAEVAIKLPSTLSSADGALIEPLAVGLYGVRCSQIQPGDKVLILGAGSVALCAMYWAKRLGAGRVVAMSRSARRQEMALMMGADEFLLFGEHESERVASAFAGKPDVVFECVGSPGFLMKSLDHVKEMGRVVSLGFCTSAEQIIPAVAGFKGVSLQFPVGYTLQDFQYTADTMHAGHVDPKILISSTAALEQISDVFSKLRQANSETKVHVTPHRV